MREDNRLPDLTFPSIHYGQKETPFDLRVLIFYGGSALNMRAAREALDIGKLGDPDFARVELVRKLHDVMQARVIAGGSIETLRNSYRLLREIFSWAEARKLPLTSDAIEKTYLLWTDHLVHRYQVIRDLSQRSAYSMAAQAGNLLDIALDRSAAIIRVTRLRFPQSRRDVQSRTAEKQNLRQTFSFGNLLQDICDGLSIHTILDGPTPIRIKLRTGEEILECLKPKKGSTAPYSQDQARKSRNIKRRDLSEEMDRIVLARSSAVNFRLEAELLMFIGQTGMNLMQASHVRLRSFFYASHLDGYVVRDRKERRGGEVQFEIFKGYRSHFERYLQWRRELFPSQDLLFPFVRLSGTQRSRPQFRLRDICKRLAIRFVPPQELRATRTNWLLRRTEDIEMTAAMAQHSKETLVRVYERPSQQRAIGEMIRFWTTHDPTLQSMTPVAPGRCDGHPAAIASIPKGVTEPDCIRPSGCLWCENHRDVDSLDYVWSLACYRHLKSIEISKWVPSASSREVHPGQLMVDRITEKLRWFKQSDMKRRDWLVEALARIDEGSYHGDWRHLIECLEGVT